MAENAKICPRCGSENFPSAEKCIICNASLKPLEGASKEFSKKWDKSIEDEGVKENILKAQEELELYNKLLRDNPKLVSAIVGKGTVLSKLGKYDEAIKCFDKAIRLDKENEEAWHKKVQVLRFAGKNEEADLLEMVMIDSFGQLKGKAKKKLEDQLADELASIEEKLGIPKDSTKKITQKRAAIPQKKPVKRTEGKSIGTTKKKKRPKVTVKTEKLVGTLKAIEDNLDITPEDAMSLWTDIVNAVDDRKKIDVELEEYKELEKQILENAVGGLQGKLDISPETLVEEIEKKKKELEDKELEEEEEEPKAVELDALEETKIAEEIGLPPDLAKEILEKLGTMREKPSTEQKTEGAPKESFLETELKKDMKSLEDELNIPKEETMEPSLEQKKETMDEEDKYYSKELDKEINGKDFIGELLTLENGEKKTSEEEAPVSVSAETPETKKKQSLIWGLGNGHGNDHNGNGEVNKYKNGTTNGLANGFNGKNGFTNGRGHPKSPKVGGKFRSLYVRVTVIILVCLLIATTYLLYLPIKNQNGRTVGSFDWPLDSTYGSTSTAPDNINIVRYSADNSYGKTTFYLKIKGPQILAGEPSGGKNRTDTLQIFIDSDRNANTGYQINGLGADYMIQIYGRNGTICNNQIDRYNKVRDPHGLDWNAWNYLGGTSAAVKANELETQVSSNVIGLNNHDWADCCFHTMSWDGYEDFSNGIAATVLGALHVNQTNINDLVMKRGPDVRMLHIDLQAIGSDITLTNINFTKVGNAAIDYFTAYINGVKSIAIVSSDRTDVVVGQTIKKDSIMTIELAANLNGIADSATLGVKINDTSDINIAKGSITLQSVLDGYVGYVASTPSTIVIDGAFGDWNNTKPVNNIVNDSNIDMTNYDVRSDGTSLFLYLKVDGELLGGTKVPWKNYATIVKTTPKPIDTDLDTVPDSVDKYPYDFNNDGIPDLQTWGTHIGGTGYDRDGDNITDYPQGPDMWLNTTIPSDYISPYAGRFVSVYIGPPPVVPIVTGEDSSYVFIDSDNSSSTGYFISGIGADYMVQISGKNGNITSKELSSFAGKTKSQWSWTVLDNNLLVGKDSKQMEIEVPTSSMTFTTSATLFFMTQDWHGWKDTTIAKNLFEMLMDQKQSPYGTLSNIIGNQPQTINFQEMISSARTDIQQNNQVQPTDNGNWPYYFYTRFT